MPQFTTYDHAESSDKRITSVIDIEDGRRLQLVTSKRSGGVLSTYVQVGKLDGDFFTFILFQDYCATLESNHIRVTAKAIREQHNRWHAKQDEIVAAANAHYKK